MSDFNITCFPFFHGKRANDVTEKPKHKKKEYSISEQAKKEKETLDTIMRALAPFSSANYQYEKKTKKKIQENKSIQPNKYNNEEQLISLIKK